MGVDFFLGITAAALAITAMGLGSEMFRCKDDSEKLDSSTTLGQNEFIVSGGGMSMTINFENETLKFRRWSDGKEFTIGGLLP